MLSYLLNKGMMITVLIAINTFPGNLFVDVWQGELLEYPYTRDWLTYMCY